MVVKSVSVPATSWWCWTLPAPAGSVLIHIGMMRPLRLTKRAWNWHPRTCNNCLAQSVQTAPSDRFQSGMLSPHKDPSLKEGLQKAIQLYIPCEFQRNIWNKCVFFRCFFSLRLMIDHDWKSDINDIMMISSVPRKSSGKNLQFDFSDFAIAIDTVR